MNERMGALKFNLVREIAHAKSVGEFDYADDLQLIVDFIDGSLPRSEKNFLFDQGVCDHVSAARWAGIKLAPFLHVSGGARE